MAELTISQILSQWSVSRPTVMLALKKGELSGRKDDEGTWQIESSEVVRWKGEPNKKPKVEDKSEFKEIKDLTDILIAELREQIQEQRKQLTIKDEQIAALTDTLQTQVKAIAQAAKPSIFSRLFGKG